MALQLSDKPAWITFLTEAGIPAAEADTYAEKFLNHRITDNNITCLTEQHLTDLDITVLGDKLSILKHVKTKFSSALSALDISEPYRLPAAAVSGIKTPIIRIKMTHAQFRKVLVDWDVYKGILKFPTCELGLYLYNACDDSVQHTLLNESTDLFTLDEASMLKTIEGIVTKHNCNSNGLQEDDNESENLQKRALKSGDEEVRLRKKAKRKLTKARKREKVLARKIEEASHSDTSVQMTS